METIDVDETTRIQSRGQKQPGCQQHHTILSNVFMADRRLPGGCLYAEIHVLKVPFLNSSVCD